MSDSEAMLKRAMRGATEVVIILVAPRDSPRPVTGLCRCTVAPSDGPGPVTGRCLTVAPRDGPGPANPFSKLDENDVLSAK
jgi:hypothetical protein